MSGSKVYMKKPLRRYERAFDEETSENAEITPDPEPEQAVNPDITSPAGIAPIMNSKRQPVRYQARPVPEKSRGTKEIQNKNASENQESA
jgi:hypothetical protein